MQTTKQHLTLRIRPDQLDRITELAAQHHMSRTQYVICMSLGEMPTARSEAMERIEALERTIERLERAYELGAASY